MTNKKKKKSLILRGYVVIHKTEPRRWIIEVYASRIQALDNCYWKNAASEGFEVRRTRLEVL